jgi:translation initiation factor 2-alpha kinase 4
MNHPNIVRYHTSWTEVDETFNSFPGIEGASESGTGTGTGFTSELGTTDSGTQEGSDSESSTEQESGSDSDSSDSVVDFDEDSSPGADLDMDFGDDLDDIDFLSVGHAQSRSVSYPSIHFGNEDDPSRPGSSNGTSAVASKKSTRASTPNQPVAVPTPPKQRRTLYIQVTHFITQKF